MKRSSPKSLSSHDISTFVFSFLLTFAALQTLFPSLVHAQQTEGWTGVCTDDGTNTGVATIAGVQCLIANLLRVAVTVIGFGGFVAMIIGSFKYMLAGTNSKGIEEGRNTITMAVAGLVVALSAYFILNFIAEFTGVKSILNFSVPQNPLPQ